MNHLKITQPGFETYTGPLGSVEFVNGVSVEPVPRVQADRLSGVMTLVEADERGRVLGAAGLAHRLVAEANTRAPVAGELLRQTEAEREAEIEKSRRDAQIVPADVFYSYEELSEIASKTGMEGLRDLGKPWKVTDRSMHGLIVKILKAQEAFSELRDKRLAEKVAAEAVAQADAATAAKQAAIDEQKRLEVEAGAPKGVSEGKFEPTYKIGDEEISIADLALATYEGSDLSIVTWNTLLSGDRDQLVSNHIAARQEFARIAAEQQDIEDLAKKAAEAAQSVTDASVRTQTLLGSSVLASTYEIGGATVQLGDIVIGAYKRFVGEESDSWTDTSVEAWNGLPGDEREALLRLELDQRLAAVEGQDGSE